MARPDATGPGRAGEVFRVFLQLGLTSFGGPIAHLAYFREAFVVRRRWLDEAEYAELVEDADLRARVFDKIRDEHARTLAMYEKITGHDDLLADNPALARSVFNRFPYLEPLNHLQVELLRRYRSGDEDELVQRGILLTMSGLATALRNSG
mgnify:CR=1 FL=1